MHVLIPVLHRPTKPTGVCRHAANLAQALAINEEVSKITLLIGEWQEDYFAQVFDLSSPKINLLTIDIPNSSLSRNRWYVLGLPKIANHLQPDIVHLSFPFPFVRRWFQVPVVATIHDLYPYECPENFGYPQVWFNQWFLRQCVGQSDGLSCVSEITLEAVQGHFPWLKHRSIPLAVVYNSVDFVEVASNCPRQISGEIADEFALCVAQHRKNKNLDLLIQVFARLGQGHGHSHLSKLVLVGSPGPETTNIQSLIQQLKLEDRVIFLSALHDSELRWLYEHCALFAIPSAMEGFCLPLVEAQALGARVVCSDIPIFREIAGPECCFFNLNCDPAQVLTQALETALAQPKPETGFVNPDFLKENTSQQYLQLYDQVFHL
ncbi:glycosyltransferase family 1 protein [filamentous cyanobacterium CCP5]|nr:glycosyltransferase family 1 protein [filamentous cyanobacterium CCP5]